MVIPSSMKGFTRVIPYMIGLIFGKTLGTLLISLLDIGNLLLCGNSVPKLINIGRPPSQIKMINKVNTRLLRIMGPTVQG